MTFRTAARDEDFWWADGASFALNGELVRDYLVSGFGGNPLVFAREWFQHYPALTISLYPPIFPLTEAAVFELFGFSHGTAQATVTMFAAAASYGLYRTMRTAVGVLPATAAGILLLATPEVLRWSREIVMDVPAMAFLLLAAAAVLRYQSEQRTKSLLLAVLLLLAAIYTKQTAIFVVPAFALALVADDGWALARDRTVWVTAAGGVIGLLPIAIFTVNCTRARTFISLLEQAPAKEVTTACRCRPFWLTGVRFRISWGLFRSWDQPAGSRWSRGKAGAVKRSGGSRF